MDSETRAIRYIFIFCITLILTVGSCQMHLDYQRATLIRFGIDPVCVAGSMGEVTTEDIAILLNRRCEEREGTSER